MPGGDAEAAAAAQAEKAVEVENTEKDIVEVSKMEITEERLNEMIAAAAKSGAEEAIKSLPPEPVKAGVAVVTDEADQPWKTAGEFFLAVKSAAYRPKDEDVRLRAVKATGMSEGVPADGGYLVHPQFAAGILERMYQNGEILSRVAADPVSQNSMVYNAVNETSRAEGSQWGGITAYWMAEGGTITSSKPAFREIELKLKKVAALAYATDEQLMDTPNLASWLNRTVPQVLTTKVEHALYRGDGVGKPLGVINSPCVVNPLREDANYIKLSDVLNMYKRRWPGGRYVWLIHQDAFPQLLQLSATNLTNLFLPYGAIANVPYNTLLGLPVIESEYCSSLGTYGDFALCDLSQYQTITNGGVQSASSIHVAFTTDETAFRFTYRIDGQATWHSALTPMNGSNTMSPFVVLSAASV
jgi:HK97 family phage major capsid protein